MSDRPYTAPQVSRFRKDTLCSYQCQVFVASILYWLVELSPEQTLAVTVDAMKTLNFFYISTSIFEFCEVVFSLPSIQ